MSTLLGITRLGLHGGPRGPYQLPAVIFDAPYNDDEDDDSYLQAQGGAGQETSLDTTQACRGVGSYYFTGDSTNTVFASVQYDRNDLYSLGSANTPFIMEGHVRFDDLTDNAQIITSVYHNTGNNRVWFTARVGTDFRFFWDSLGTDNQPTTADQEDRTVNWVVNTWYHWAVSRDHLGDIRIFFNGTQQGAAFNPGVAFYVPTAAEARLRVGAHSSSGTTVPFSGNQDDVKITLNRAYTADFTPPVCNFGLRKGFEGFRQNIGRMMR